MPPQQAANLPISQSLNRMSLPVYFAHITDTHIGPTPEYERHGFRPYPCAVRLVELLNNLPTRPDFIVHTGDVVTHPSEAAYALAAGVFARLTIPIYYVNGNHDTAADIRRWLPMGPKEDLADSEALAYAFEVKGYRFVTLDGRGPDAIDPHGILSQKQLAWLRRAAQPDGPPLTVFIHFPALPMNAPWMDANMLLLNGAAFHEALLPARDRLRGVFYGHVHQPMTTWRDGILYSCAPSAFAQFNAWPADEQVRMDPEFPPGFGFVHLLPEQTIIHHHTFARPA